MHPAHGTSNQLYGILYVAMLGMPISSHGIIF